MDSDTQNTLNTKIIINKINDVFKIPIFYNKDKTELNEDIIQNLELIETIDKYKQNLREKEKEEQNHDVDIDTEINKSIYYYFFNNDNDISFCLNKQITKYYTTDVNFLKDTQTLLKEFKIENIQNKYTNFSQNYKNIIDNWTDITTDIDFKEKYYYVEWDKFEFLNKSDVFLQVMSFYNIMSPVFSLIMPIIILIIPFFILKLNSKSITIEDYLNVLSSIASQNAIGKLFLSNFNEMQMSEITYVIVSAIFYIFSIYQNILVCIRFNKNMTNIHNYFKELSIFIKSSINGMENYLSYFNKLQSYNFFNLQVQEKLTILKDLLTKLERISEYNFTSLFKMSKFVELGNILKFFYELHTDNNYNTVILYSLGFHGYIDCILGLQQNIFERKISFTKFCKNKKENKLFFKNNYYGPLKDYNPIKNTVYLDKNIIITGPNASGKTTILKSTIINIILSQQFGCGFYDKANLKPFKYLHCYLNIPDTSGRDSLFQAEARRCKDILNIIQKSKIKETHFCIFDELFSGTNPDEAISSAKAFLNYINKNNNVKFIITTHFVKLCEYLENETTIINYKMDVVVKDHIKDKNIEKNDIQICNKSNIKEKSFIYNYLMKEGISYIKGGVQILKDLNYPKEIISNTLL